MKTFNYYEEQSKNKYERRCIDGKVTHSGKCIGYCECSLHSGFLTREQRKQHDCIVKQCFYYVPKTKNNKNDPYKGGDFNGIVFLE